ncbi:GNAT family N-acetyltransferase [Planctomycetes bacterium K23_9]|uniref:Phosphinothricin N-acetyltransferase n=1 Tax=Stieleria marina TaxID=1930275 RepID=A0A517NMH3_9BACT|nr:Phosphinothricin N-acetyltransferase [Planctomycetes bacterium K23_9]
MDINEVLIRPVSQAESGPADAQQIAAIYNHYIEIGEATFDRDPWTAARVTELLSAPLPNGWYVADHDGQIIGWSSARQFSDRHGYRLSCETAIYLSTDAIGRNVADLLQQQIDQHCRQNQLHHAVAKIIATNDRSLAFHYRHGYELVGTQKEIGHLNGQWSDVTILQKIYQ